MIRLTSFTPLGGAMVVYDGIEYAVKESPSEVARKMLEWRLAMEKYRVFALTWTQEKDHDWKEDHFNGMVSSEEKLRQLAGLEESGNESQ